MKPIKNENLRELMLYDLKLAADLLLKYHEEENPDRYYLALITVREITDTLFNLQHGII
jgi:hypothetical protein